MKFIKLIPTLGIAAVFAAATALTGCDGEVENAAEDTGEAVEDTAEDVGEGVEDAVE